MVEIMAETKIDIDKLSREKWLKVKKKIIKIGKKLLFFRY